MLNLIKKKEKKGKKILIIEEEVEGEEIEDIVVNKLSGKIKVCEVKDNGFGDRSKEMLEDIEVLKGGSWIKEDLGIKLERVKMKDLGREKRIKIDKEKKKIVEGEGK